MFALIDIKTGVTLKKAKKAYNLFNYMDQLVADRKYDARQLKIIIK